MYNRKLLIVLTRKGRGYLYISALILIAASILCSSLVYNLCFAQKDNGCVIIDPGHGGLYTGITDNSLFLEKNFNLQLAWKLRDQLETLNIKTEMTREDDQALENTSSSMDSEVRAKKFNSGKYNIFISLHVIKSTSERDAGSMVLYSENNNKSSLLADCVQIRLNSLYKKVHGVNIERAPLKSGYPMLKDANIPGVLVEAGFISNPTEKQRLQDASYQTELAKQISIGIKEYLEKSEKLKEKPGKPVAHPYEETVPLGIEAHSRLVRNTCIILQRPTRT